MDLVVEVRTGRDRVTMACHGKLVGGREAEAFRRNAMLLIGGFDTLTINLGGVRSLDCGGMGCLATVLEAARQRGRMVRISNASRLVCEALEVIGLGDFLQQPAPPQLAPVPSQAAAVA
jgi:anti-anti-sigma factor